VLLRANSTGTDQLLLIVIGKYRRSRRFKSVRHLSCQYHHNVKVRMTREAFSMWILSLECRMKTKSKILPVTDKCLEHKNVPRNVKNVKCVFLLPKCTSILRPLDQGIINAAK
jgi:hypothetical protein